MQAEITPELERVLEASLARRRRHFVSREAAVEAAFAVAFFVAAFALAFAGADGDHQIPLLGAFVLAYASVASAQFDTGAGYVTAVTVLLVPMLLLTDAALVPLLVALALVVTATARLSRGLVSAERVLSAVGDAWYAFFPAIVLVVADPGTPSWGDVPIYAAAFAAQIAGDAAFSMMRAYLALGIRPREIVGELIEAYRMDVLLAPVGLLAALAAVGEPAAALLVLPLVLLFKNFAREREARIEQTLELSRAYRGTALLLGDVIEDDDAYTGEHTRGVVELTVAVGRELGVDEQTLQDCEFAALLHDVGKVRIPNEIINKPGPLDEDEWALMRTHTIEGQKMLARVGGVLGRVGEVVRASHERWDGRGYPDGLSTDQIPLAARVVSACDAYNAMTTDRSYRRALPVDVAMTEMETCAGTQFDPQVVAALLRVLSSARTAQSGDPAPPPVAGLRVVDTRS